MTVSKMSSVVEYLLNPESEWWRPPERFCTFKKALAADIGRQRRIEPLCDWEVFLISIGFELESFTEGTREEPRIYMNTKFCFEIYKDRVFNYMRSDLDHEYYVPMNLEQYYQPFTIEKQ